MSESRVRFSLAAPIIMHPKKAQEQREKMRELILRRKLREQGRRADPKNRSAESMKNRMRQKMKEK